MRLIISGGGTGGHIYPAISIIKEVKKHHPDGEVLYIGTKKGLESKLVPREGIDFQTIDITGFRRKLSFENVKTVLRFINGVRKAKRMIKQFQPDVVIGTGGYVSAPVVYAATKLNIPTVIHEQNSVPGLTNKFLSRYVTKVAIAFKEASAYFPEEKTVLIGNPRAQEVVHMDGRQGRDSVGLKNDKRSVLIVGGSQGARPINDAFLEALPKAHLYDYQFLYVTGELHYDKVMAEVQKLGNPKNVIIKPFIHNMPQVLAGIDLIVARAGATTLAEITALGIPSILIPSPYVTNNHQEKNARALSDHGAAILRLEKDLNGENLLQDIDEIFTEKDRWNMMHEAAKKIGMPNAATDFYDLLQTLKK